MAINRFSPIQGLPEWQPQIPLDILVKGLTYKQELFDKNKALLESNVAIGKSVADRILNDEAKKYTQDKINSYKTYLNSNLAYADLTDDAIMKTADTKLADVTSDSNIINWVSKSGATSKELSRIDELKKKGDGRYDQLHENSFLLDVNAMKKAKMDEGLNMPTPTYTDFYDADKEKQELIKNFKPNHTKITKVLPNGRMIEIEDNSGKAIVLVNQNKADLFITEQQPWFHHCSESATIISNSSLLTSTTERRPCRRSPICGSEGSALMCARPTGFFNFL